MRYCAFSTGLVEEDADNQKLELRLNLHQHADPLVSLDGCGKPDYPHNPPPQARKLLQTSQQLHSSTAVAVAPSFRCTQSELAKF
jgi:hypothetical protein